MQFQLICGLVIALCVSSGMGASYSALYEQYTRKEYNRVWHALHGTFFPILNSLPLTYLLFVYLVNGFGELVACHVRVTLYVFYVLSKSYEFQSSGNKYSQGKAEAY